MTNVENDLWIFTIWVQALIFNGNNLIGLQKGAVKFHNLPHMRFYNFLSVSQKKERQRKNKVEKLKFHDQVTEKRRDIKKSEARHDTL